MLLVKKFLEGAPDSLWTLAAKYEWFALVLILLAWTYYSTVGRIDDQEVDE